MNISIIDAPLASGADVVTTGMGNSAIVAIKGLSPFQKGLIRKAAFLKSKLPTPQVWSATATAVAGGTYHFGVQIVQEGNINNYDFYYTTTTALGSEIDTAVEAWVAANSNIFGALTVITASNSGAGVTVAISGSAVRPLVTAYGGEGFTVVDNMPSYTLAVSSAQVVGAPITLTFDAAHGLLSGNVIKLGTVSVGGLNAPLISGKQVRVQWLTATTVTLPDVLALATTVLGTGATADLVPQESFGAPAEVTQDAISNFSAQVATVSGYHYNCLELSLGYANDNVPVQNTRLAVVRVWYPYNIDTAATTIFTNAASLETALAAVIA